MAVVTLGGLVTSTVLNLFLLPTLYYRCGRRARGPHACGSCAAWVTSWARMMTDVRMQAR